VNCSFSAVLWYLICCRWGYWLSDQSEARTNGRIAFVFSDTCSLGSWAKGSSDSWPLAMVYMTVHNGGDIKWSLAVPPFAASMYLSM
jgi:hypothetical protein